MVPTELCEHQGSAPEAALYELIFVVTVIALIVAFVCDILGYNPDHGSQQLAST
jgi:cation transporter-like permease